jgi:hypothetical protein
MPVSFAQAASQNARWERGRMQLLRHHVLPLIGRAVRGRSWMSLDAAIDQLIPPLSVPFALGGACLVLSVLAGAWLAAALAAASVIGQAVYLLAALGLVGASRREYLSLALAPFYIAWKVSLYARAAFGSRSTRWVRTARVASS